MAVVARHDSVHEITAALDGRLRADSADGERHGGNPHDDASHDLSPFELPCCAKRNTRYCHGQLHHSRQMWNTWRDALVLTPTPPPEVSAMDDTRRDFL